MPTKRNRIKDVVRDLIDGIECPTEEIMNGKKVMVCKGDFITLEAEPTNGDIAFIVNGEEGDKYCYFVEVTAVNMHEIKY